MNLIRARKINFTANSDVAMRSGSRMRCSWAKGEVGRPTFVQREWPTAKPNHYLAP